MILSTSLPSLHKTSIFLFAITLSFYVTKVHATTITNNYRSTIFISNGLLPAGNDEIILNSAESITIPEAWGNPRHRYVHIRDSAGKQLSGAMANKYGTLKLAALENYVIVNTPDAQVYLANEDIPEGGDIEEPESNPEGNLLKNSNFTDKLTHWNCAGTVAITDEKSLILTPDMVTTSRVSQIVTGLETGVEYQLSANIDSTNVWAYIGVRKVTERGAASSGILKMKFIAPANRIKVYLQTWKKQNGNAVFTSVVLKKVASGDDNNGSGEEGEVPQLVYGEVRNSGFENGTDEWQVVSGNENVIIAEVDAYQEKSYLRMISSESTVKIKQDIAVKPETMYTCAVRMRLCRKNITVPLNALAGMFEIKGDTQRNIVNNSRFNKLVVERLDWAGEEQEDVWLEKRTIFYTAVDAKNVTLYLTVDKGSAGTVDFDSIRLIEGNMDIPEEYANIQRMRPDLPEVKMSGENMIANNTFFDGTKKWLTSGTVIAQNGSIKLISGELSARAIQETEVFLAPKTTYTLSFDCLTNNVVADIIFRSPEVEWNLQTNSKTWKRETLEFTTPDKFVKGKLILQVYKKQNGDASFSNIVLNAKGGEWLPGPDGSQPRKTTAVLFDDFSNNCLDPNNWLVVKKGWGGDNRGVIPENISIENGILKLNGFGDLHAGLTRAGAAIATRHYYASASYEVKARLAPDLGACSAFWTFHYDRKFPDELNYWTDGNPVRNTEIDWEFPTAMSDGRPNDPISFKNLRANSWGGKVGGEGAHHPGRVEADADLSEDWHVYRFDWHSTGTTDDPTPRIEYFIDDIKVYEIRGNSWGQDNIGYRATRFWLGVWFPAAGWAPSGDVGWAGSPNFDTTCLQIDWVRITPFNELNDKWEPELLPNEFYASPHKYPGYGSPDFPPIK